jgi:hypothetical protein
MSGEDDDEDDEDGDGSHSDEQYKPRRARAAAPTRKRPPLRSASNASELASQPGASTPQPGTRKVGGRPLGGGAWLGTVPGPVCRGASGGPLQPVRTSSARQTL